MSLWTHLKAESIFEGLKGVFSLFGKKTLAEQIQVLSMARGGLWSPEDEAAMQRILHEIEAIYAAAKAARTQPIISFEMNNGQSVNIELEDNIVVVYDIYRAYSKKRFKDEVGGLLGMAAGKYDANGLRQYILALRDASRIEPDEAIFFENDAKVKHTKTQRIVPVNLVQPILFLNRMAATFNSAVRNTRVTGKAAENIGCQAIADWLDTESFPSANMASSVKAARDELPTLEAMKQHNLKRADEIDASYTGWRRILRWL